MKRLTLFAAVLVLAGLTSRGYGFVLEVGSWEKERIPVPYYVNPTGSTDVSGEDFTAAIRAASKVWEGPDTALRFEYAGPTDATPSVYYRPAPTDGINEVGWMDDWEGIDPDFIAVTSYWWDGDENITEFDMIFRTNLLPSDDCDEIHWSAGRPEGVRPVYCGQDVQSMATHEFGHALGLDHSPLTQAVMYPTLSRGATKYPAADDRAGLTYLYPSPAPEAAVGPPNGLLARYTYGPGLSGSFQRMDPELNFDWTYSSLEPTPDDVTGTWTGELLAPGTGNYRLFVQTNGKARLWLDKQLVIDHWTDPVKEVEWSVTAPLTQGKRYPLKVEFSNTGWDWTLTKLLWSGDGLPKSVIPQSHLSASGNPHVLTASQRAMVAGDTVQLTLKPEQPVTWSLLGDGSIDPDGTYHAPDDVATDRSVEIDALDGDIPIASLRIPLLTYRPGDVDQDLTVDVTDAVLTLRSIVGLASLDKAQMRAGDVVHNGQIDVNDAIFILRMIAGLESP